MPPLCYPYEAGWAPGPVCMGMKGEDLLAPPGYKPQIVFCIFFLTRVL